MTSATDHITEKDIAAFLALLTPALRALYTEHLRTHVMALGSNADNVELTNAGVIARIEEFAADRANKVRDGINSRIDSALAQLGDDADDADVQDALKQVRAEVDHYNEHKLIPFLSAWVQTQALRDVYDRSETPGGQSLLDAGDWDWTQHTDYKDDCTAAESASPAPLKELERIAGGPPPAHPGCQCTVTPVALPDDMKPESDAIWLGD